MAACTPFRSTPLSGELGHGSLDCLISGAIVPQLWSRTSLNARAQKSFGRPGCVNGISILQRSGQGIMREVADNAVKSDREANNDFVRYVGFAD